MLLEKQITYQGMHSLEQSVGRKAHALYLIYKQLQKLINSS